MTLDQREFELHGSTSMWIFFNSEYNSTTQSIYWLNPGMQNHRYVGTKLYIQTTDYKLQADFKFHRGSVPLLSKSSRVNCSDCFHHCTNVNKQLLSAAQIFKGNKN